MSLDKLIQQYERDTKQEAHINRPFNFDYTSRFVEWLANRPTCGIEQRKFLDEIETKGIVRDWSHEMKVGDDSYLEQSDFTADFSKVIKGE